MKKPGGDVSPCRQRCSTVFWFGEERRDLQNATKVICHELQVASEQQLPANFIHTSRLVNLPMRQLYRHSGRRLCICLA